jgi:Leucine-rich repeat (LRR) protein
VPRLEVLDISGNTLVSDLRFLWYIPNVTKLNVSETGVMDDNLSCLRYTPKLEQLFIHDTEITDAGVTHMLVLTKLTALDMSDTNVTDAGYNFLKKSLVNLAELWNGQSYTVTEDDLCEMDDV